MKGNSRKSRVIELWPTVHDLLQEEYSEAKPKAPHFTAHINNILIDHIRNNYILARKYPHLSLVISDPEKGLYLKDSKLDQAIELEVTLEEDNPNLVTCKRDKDRHCEHVEFVLLSLAVVGMLQHIPLLRPHHEEEDEDTTPSSLNISDMTHPSLT
jgi:hypothetical protein